MVSNPQQSAVESFEKIRRKRAELREMLDKLERDVKALEAQRGARPLPSQVHPLPSVYVERGFDMSKVDPIFREAAKDKALRIRFMDCTDLAMQCAFIRHTT
jgi:hypothetical protein